MSGVGVSSWVCVQLDVSPGVCVPRVCVCVSSNCVYPPDPEAHPPDP